MKRRIIIFVSLFILIILTGWSSSLAAEGDIKYYKIKVNNYSDEVMVLYLRDKETLVFELPPGERKIKVAEGEYEYFFEICDGDFYGSVTVDNNDIVFEIKNCSEQPIPTKIAIYSHFGDPTAVTLANLDEDSESYKFTVDLGKTR
ncbi:MAG: hypothetical protein OEZ02_02790, partial [Anaerolineae bacterium]|nr:hypothetical protein [Anaerolineae bacterium]